MENTTRAIRGIEQALNRYDLAWDDIQAGDRTNVAGWVVTLASGHKLYAEHKRQLITEVIPAYLTDLYDSARMRA
jgi:hypothetical protein